MRAASSASNKQDAARFRRRCKELIALAEKLKTQLPNPRPSTLSDGSDILRKASWLHGNEFPPWDNDPSDAEFQRLSGQHLFTYAPNASSAVQITNVGRSDKSTFSLSAIQTENFLQWQRPQQLVGMDDDDDMEALMRPSEACNLVQDATTDCSVVASLSAAIVMLIGKHSVSFQWQHLVIRC